MPNMKTFAGGSKITKFVQVFSLKSFPLNGTDLHLHTSVCTCTCTCTCSCTSFCLRSFLYSSLMSCVCSSAAWRAWRSEINSSDESATAAGGGGVGVAGGGCGFEGDCGC